jgi:hypothetical protein
MMDMSRSTYYTNENEGGKNLGYESQRSPVTMQSKSSPD